MILIVGGAFQGKTAFAGKLAQETGGYVIDAVQEFVRELWKSGHSREEIEEMLIQKAEGRQAIFVADEIGCGIVPVDAFEREYREVTGRIVGRLAGLCDTVYRVIAGIPVKIKG